MKHLTARRSAGALAGMAGVLLAAFPAITAAQNIRATPSGRALLYSGPRVGMRWGPVEATITVKHRRIVDVAIDVTGDAVRSNFIERHAVPLLRQETLQAQSLYINTVSGATQTSQAYIQSLGVALQKAYRARTLSAQ